MTIKRWAFNNAMDGWATRDTLDTEVSAKCVETHTGHLELCLKKTAGQVVEAMISTEASFQFTYGTVRARMTFRGPSGAHSALWLIPPGDTYAQPRGHEVDVVEHFGSNNKVQHHVYGLERAHLFGDATTLNPRVPHVCEVMWTPDRYTWRIDRSTVCEWVGETSNVPHFVVLSYLSSDWERSELDMANLWKYRTDVDWVEVQT